MAVGRRYEKGDLVIYKREGEESEIVRRVRLDFFFNIYRDM